MISADDLKKNDDSAALVLDNTKDFDALTYDAAKAITELCASVRELQKQLQDCRDLRDSWCAAYTELRDNPQAKAN